MKAEGERRIRRSGTVLAAFLFGLPLAGSILAGVHFQLIPSETVLRYLNFPAEKAALVLFCCALGTLLGKLLQNATERRACRLAVLEAWDGKTKPVSDAGPLLASLARLPRRFRKTYLVQRVEAILDFICQRGSTQELDDHLRTLADNDSVHLETSYALTRFITWAIPILGFLGTVLGITNAISGVTPEVLENNMNRVTDGLSEAFDATALALALTMVTMFLSFLVERFEQAVLERVDQYVDQQLAHRFVRLAADSAPFVAAVEQNSQVLLNATGRLVKRQSRLWARTFAETEKQLAQAHLQQQEQLSTSLEQALARTLQSHSQRLSELEQQTLQQSTKLMEHLASLAGAVRDTSHEQHAALTQVAQAIHGQTRALGELKDQEKHLLHLQALLHQNLETLAASGTFEQAVHSLTAAIHLLTARVTGRPPSGGMAQEMPVTPLKLSSPGSSPQTGKAA